MTEPAAPPAAAPQQPAPPAAAAPAEPETGQGGLLTSAEEALLGELQARRAAAAGAAGAVQMKVEPPHDSITYGGLTVGAEFTTVPASMVAAITTAASEAGVTITQES